MVKSAQKVVSDILCRGQSGKVNTYFDTLDRA